MDYAIILGGGKSARMGTDKLALEIDGKNLLSRGVEAASSAAGRVIVAGPERSDVEAEFVQEQPPFGGPVAGIAAVVRRLPEEDAEVLLLAGDLAEPAAAVEALRGIPLETDAVVLTGTDGWPHWLTGKYRLSALRRALAAVRDVDGAALHRVFRTLEIDAVPLDEETVDDVDTVEQARVLGIQGLPESLA